MAATFRCENPACRKLLRVREGLAGKRVKCPGCGRVMAAPAGGGPPAKAPGPEHLVEQLNVPEYKVRDAAARELARRGPAGLDVLIREVARRVPDRRDSAWWSIAEVLLEQEDPRVAERIVGSVLPHYAGSDGLATRLWDRGVQRFGRVRDPQAVSEVVSLLRHESFLKRAFAAEVLEQVGDPATAGALREALRDPNESVRSRAARALARLGDASDADRLLEALRRDPRDAAPIEALARLKDARAVGPLLAVLEEEMRVLRGVPPDQGSGDSKIGWAADAAVRALAQIGVVGPVAALFERAAAEQHNTTRWRLVKVLAGIDDPAAVRPLIAGLRDQRISGEVAEALRAKLAGPGAVLPEDLEALAALPDSVPYRKFFCSEYGEEPSWSEYRVVPLSCAEVRELARKRLAAG
jgi:HEAT repeat protein